jgi:N-acetyl-anhydromuramyl-L-alanine amidase AmpD
LARDGTSHVVAAGRANHADPGKWQGIANGNSAFIDIEAENTAKKNDNPWLEIQMDAYARGVAALLKHVGAKPIMCAGHLEYATPVGRKPDPSFSIGNRNARIAAMNKFRARVATLMGQGD